MTQPPGRSARCGLGTVLLGLLACTSAGTLPAARETGSQAAPALSQSDTAALMDLAGVEFARLRRTRPLVVRPALVSRTSLYVQEPIAEARPSEVDPLVLRFAVAAGATIDPWTGPNSPWQTAFLAGTSGPGLSVWLHTPHIEERAAWLDVDEVFLQPGISPPVNALEVWRYLFARAEVGGAWEFRGAELVLAH